MVYALEMLRSRITPLKQSQLQQNDVEDNAVDDGQDETVVKMIIELEVEQSELKRVRRQTKISDS